MSEAPIIVLRSDGSPVVSDLTSVRLYFWNAGKKAIRREQVLEPIIIHLIDKDAIILSIETVHQSRAITGLKFVDEVLLSMAEPRNLFDPEANAENVQYPSISVDFDILEQNDGAILQIIYEGNPDAEFILSGILEEYGDLFNARADTFDNARISQRLPFISMVFIAVFFIFSSFMKVIFSRRFPPFSSRTFTRVYYVIQTLFLAGVITYLFWGLHIYNLLLPPWP